MTGGGASADPHAVETLTALETLYDAANPNSLAKETPRLTEPYRRWIEAARFFVIASGGPGGMDCSPRGDGPGAAFAVLDAETLAIPDRRGNNRLDTLRNILTDPRVGLLFLIPGALETLRVNGRARLTTDPELTARFAVDDRSPVTVILVTIDAVYFQCARALIRSELWKPEARVDPATLPSAGEMTRSGAPEFDADAYDTALRPRQMRTLY